MGRIDALYVEIRVRFSIARLLRLGKHFGVIGVFFLHFAKNKIAGAIEDTNQFLHAITRQAFPENLDHWDSASDRSFKGDDQTCCRRLLEDLVTASCYERLIGCHHMLALGQCCGNQIERHFAPADQLHHHINARVRNDLVRISGQGYPGCITMTPTGKIPYGSAGDLDFAAGATCNLFLVSVQQVDGTRADGTQSDHSDIYSFHIPLIRREGLSAVSDIIYARRARDCIAKQLGCCAPYHETGHCPKTERDRSHCESNGITS